MGFLSYLKFGFCDLFDKVRISKWKFVLCVVITVVGFALGIALFNLTQYGWWYYNRCSYASKLIDAGFGVLVSMLLSVAIVYLLCVLCKMTRFTHYFVTVIDFVACLYCGATTSAIFIYSVALGVLFAVFLTVEWLLTMCLGAFVCLCDRPLCRTFCESARDCKQLLFVLLLGLVYKIFALFVILRILTALI